MWAQQKICLKELNFLDQITGATLEPPANHTANQHAFSVTQHAYAGLCRPPAYNPAQQPGTWRVGHTCISPLRPLACPHNTFYQQAQKLNGCECSSRSCGEGGAGAATEVGLFLVCVLQSNCVQRARGATHNSRNSNVCPAGTVCACRTKLNQASDRSFYSIPRFVKHVDDGFLAQVTELYRQRIQPGLCERHCQLLQPSGSGSSLFGLSAASPIRTGRQLQQVAAS